MTLTPDIAPHVEELVQRYPRAIAHLWRQRSEKRLSLLFGAGASQPLRFPSWEDLVAHLRDHREVNARASGGTSVKRDPLPSVAEVTFQHYRNRNLDSVLKDCEGNLNTADRVIMARWVQLIREELYREAPKTGSALLRRDRVYKHFLDIIRVSPLTVTYNFDDSIERLLLTTRRGSVAEAKRGYDTIVDIRLPFRLQTGNIFHVNGFIPYNDLEMTSEAVVLGESAFEDQVLDVIAGSHTSLLHSVSKHTYLLVGTSLQDQSLRHLLHQSAFLNPGHVHYRIEYIGETRGRFSEDRKRDLVDAHFDAYNLVTLFLSAPEIAALGRVLAAKHEELLDFLDSPLGMNRETLFFTYYLTGVPGVGKTTSFRHFTSLRAHDELSDERHPLLRKAWTKLNDRQRAEVDDWIAGQFEKKNRRLRDECSNPGIGMNIVDRCPLDPMAFVSASDWSVRADALRKTIRGRRASSIEPGRVILLTADVNETLRRARTKNRQLGANPGLVQDQQDTYLQTVYASPGCVQVKCNDLSIFEMTKEVARQVFLTPYEPAQLDDRLADFARGVILPSSGAGP